MLHLHRVLKNFPDEVALRAAVAPWAERVQFHEWTYHWALSYVLPDPAGATRVA